MDHDTKNCLVCHEAIEIFAIGTCDHPICFKCSTRMRSLCEQFYCPICRTDLHEVVFVKRLKKWEQISRRNFIAYRKIRVVFEDDEVREKYDKLLEHRCTVCKGRIPERSFTALRDHMRRQHTLFYCDLCVEHLKIFTFERKTYTRQELATHRRLGDKDDTSYKGHPLCQFCEERYMDNDELLRHLRKDHFYCHFCDHEGSHEYYCDYESLKEHFRNKHYLCEEDECLTARFTHAFRSLIDMKAHKASCHKMSKAESRLARTLDIDIQLAPRPRNRGRGAATRDDFGQDSHGRGSGRGRQRFGNFREAEDVDRAIQASLMTMKEPEPVEKACKEVKEKVKEPPKPVPPSPKIAQDEENFPTLSGTQNPAPIVTSRNMDKNRSCSPLVPEPVMPMATQVALTNKMSVQHGQLGLKEFPSLKQYVSNYATSSLSEQLKAPVKSVEPPKTVAKEPQHIKKSGTGHPKSSFGRRPVQGYTESEDDFPELPLSVPLGGGRSGATSSTWSNQSLPMSKNMMTVSESEFSELQNSESGMKKSKFDIVKPSLVSLSKALADDSEFPSLGGQSKNSAVLGWVKKGGNVNSKNNNKNSNTSSSANKGRTSPFRFEDLKWNSDDDRPPVVEDTSDKNKSKKKKKKKGKSEPGQSLILPEKKENASLDSIASMLLNGSPENSHEEGRTRSTEKMDDFAPESEFVKVQSGKKDKKKAAAKSKEPNDIHIPVGGSPISVNIKHSSHSGNSPVVKHPKHSGRKSPVEKQPEKANKVESGSSDLVGRSDVDLDVTERERLAKIQMGKQVMIDDDDFPTLGVGSATHSFQSKRISPVMTQTKDSSKIQDDFPALGIESVVAPVKPVGKKSTQPAFKVDDDFPALAVGSASGLKAPPGFGGIAVSDQKSNPTKSAASPPPGFSKPNKQNLDGAKFDLKTLLPITTDTANYLYIQPEKFQARNHQLITDIQQVLMHDQDKFNMFKVYSGDFRHGKIQASEYYENCKELLGSEEFECIFPDLLVLLPDIEKQQELLAAHSKVSGHRRGDGVLHISDKGKTSPWAVPAKEFVSCPTCHQVLLGEDYDFHLSGHSGELDYPALQTQSSSLSLARMGAWVKAK